MERSDQIEVFQNTKSPSHTNQLGFVDMHRNRLFSESTLNDNYRLPVGFKVW